MKKLLITFALLSCVSIAHSLPTKNKWFVGAGQGYVEHSISNDKNQVFTLSCNEGAGDEADHSVFLTMNDQFISDNLEVTLDSGPEEFTVLIPSGTNSRVEAETWQAFIEYLNMPFGMPMTVSQNGKVIATFNPSNPIDLDLDSCKSMFYQDF